jgi:adenosylhomocysteine nucleosidase
MWLRWVVSNLLSQVAEEKVRKAVDKARHVVEPALRRQGEQADAEPQEPAGPCETLVIFALGLESGGLVDRMENVVTMQCASFVERSGQLDGKRLVICESGVGREAAAKATEDALRVHQPRWVVSAGFAAALSPDLRRGHILMADSVVDAQQQRLDVGFRIDPDLVQANPSLHVGKLLTIDHLIRDRAEKEQLADHHDAIACDMETMAIAQVCQQQQVRFLSVRIISDQMDDTLPREIEHMLDQASVAGKIGAATRAIWERPGSVKDMWKLRETAIRAADRLAGFLIGVLPQLEQPPGDSASKV